MACSSSDRSKMESDDVIRVSKYGKKRAVAVLSEDEDEIDPLNLKKSAPPKKSQPFYRNLMLIWKAYPINAT
ncbi:hypothetical protein JTE90_012411 [Oedothorax gibbosus]|uniref:Uncharacterized protein n=1 Tax=Oedothorax gibbosus TaxID=931172 RepID=A0AAV6TWZ2_9ARAC|nr:hypothetical protein JTE90_012411 [Oedothorax gibbosus]